MGEKKTLIKKIRKKRILLYFFCFRSFSRFSLKVSRFSLKVWKVGMRDGIIQKIWNDSYFRLFRIVAGSKDWQKTLHKKVLKLFTDRQLVIFHRQYFFIVLYITWYKCCDLFGCLKVKYLYVENVFSKPGRSLKAEMQALDLWCNFSLWVPFFCLSVCLIQNSACFNLPKARQMLLPSYRIKTRWRATFWTWAENCSFQNN